MCNIVIDAYDYSSIEVVFILYILMRMDLSIIALVRYDTNIYIICNLENKKLPLYKNI